MEIEASKLCKKLDKNKDGKICIDEFREYFECRAAKVTLDVFLVL